MARRIGIRHRIKFSAEGEARPTQVCIIDGEQVTKYDLPTETDELDWISGVFPIKMRPVKADEDLSIFRDHQIDWKEQKSDEKHQRNHVKTVGKTTYYAKRVPAEFDGLKADDVVAMTLGGSGDYLAFAISNQADKVGAKIMRCQPVRLKEERDKLEKKDDDKDLDTEILARLVQARPEIFYDLRTRDRNLIKIRINTALLSEIIKERIGCEQRLHQRIIGQIFCQPEGLFPQGGIEKAKQDAMANDTILASLILEEKRRENELAKSLKNFDVYNQLFEPIEGVGPRIASRVISAVQDIRRFSNEAGMKKFFGVAVDNEQPLGLQFPRKRRGHELGYNPEARQALYLLGDQFNRRPNSVWGIKLKEYKVKLRAVHPDVMCKACNCKHADCPTPKVSGHVKMYTDGHIHKMATWRTLTKFVEWLHREWWRLEKEANVSRTETVFKKAVNE